MNYFRFGNNVKVAHFIGASKPWHHRYNTVTGQVELQEGSGHSQEFLQIWWDIFMSLVQPHLSPEMVGIYVWWHLRYMCEGVMIKKAKWHFTQLRSRNPIFIHYTKVE